MGEGQRDGTVRMDDPARAARARVTVIACLRDPGALLGSFLDRVAAVAAGGSQVVLVDDASTDGSAAVLRDFAAARPAVTLLTNAQNTGVARSRNRALTAADRDYVWFVDDDDEWSDRAVDVLATAATTTDADLVVCRALYVHDPALPGRIVDGVDRHGTTTGTELLGLMLRGDVHGFLWSKLVRRTLLGDDPFPDISSQSDFVGLTVAAAAAERVTLVPDVLYRYRNRAGSITRVRTPRLENLATARDALLRVVADRPGLRDRREDVEYFTAWFYCAAVAFTPIRQGADRAARADGLDRARRGLADVRLARLARRDPVLAAGMATVRYAGPVWSVTVPVLLRGQRTLRTIRARRSSARPTGPRGARPSAPGTAPAPAAVLYVGVHDPDYPRNRRIRQYLTERGHEVTVLPKPRGGLVSRLVGTLRGLVRAGRRHDVVVVSEFGTTLVPLVQTVTRLRGQRLVVDGFVSLHETHVEDWSTFRPDSWQSRLLRAADRFALRAADLTLVDTDVRRDALLADAPGRTDVLTLPVGAPSWARETGPAPVAGPLRVLYYGNYIPLHGLDVVVAAVADAAARAPIALTLLGDGGGRRAVVDDVARRGIADRCTLRGPVPEAALAEVVADHHVVLGVFGGSAKAGSVIANKVWQGLACGRTVVTRESPALDELRPVVGDQLVSVRPGSASALADALVALATGLEARGDTAAPRTSDAPRASTAVLATTRRTGARTTTPTTTDTATALARAVDERFTQLGAWLDATDAARRHRTR